jgi:hypothetical protein
MQWLGTSVAPHHLTIATEVRSSIFLDFGKMNFLGIEGRNAFTSPSIMSPLMTPSSKHQNALLKGLLDDE